MTTDESIEMIVMKFGGTSVQDAAAIRKVIEIVRGRIPANPLVVVSAFSKVTRLLCKIAEEAEAQHFDAVSELTLSLQERHIGTAGELLDGNPDLMRETTGKVEALCSELREFTEGICRIGELSPRSNARILSFGELLSSIIVSAAMNASGLKCRWADARRMIITDEDYMGAAPDLETSAANIRREIPAMAKGMDLILTQGFISSTYKGATSVLGFEGSDYSAAIFAMSLDAERVEIWTDVDGIRTADPRVVEKTARIEKISYEEAGEMAFLGARVLHPFTIEPARRKNIPIHVLNSSNPSCPGSAVVQDSGIPQGPKSVALLKEVEFVEVFPSGTSGIAANVGDICRILNSNKIKVSLLSSSDTKVAFAAESGQPGFSEALSMLETLGRIIHHRDKSQIAVVGKDVVTCGGVAERILAGGPVSLAVAGPDLMSLSTITERDRAEEVVKGIHGALFED